MAETLAESSHWGHHLNTPLQGYVGIDTVQEQVKRVVSKQGFEFNILVVGRSGLGKTTLINTLFQANVSRRTCSKDKSTPIIPKTTKVMSISHVLEERGMKLRLTVTDTPGFGDHINNENCWLPILEYINEQYEKYLSEEQCISRKPRIPDTRVHCCLYFIPPTGHRLAPLDLELMKKLDQCVNIVPVIAKSDTLTLEEREDFKRKIKEDLAAHNIHIYPSPDLDLDPEDQVINNSIREKLPFAIVGSQVQHQAEDGRQVIGRKTVWGLVEVENKAHCEFPDLRDLLVRTHMCHLVEVTRVHHYERFRLERLQASSRNLDSLSESSL